MACVTFYRFPDEEEAFLSFLNETGSIVALPFDGVLSKEELVPQPLLEFMQRDNLDVLFIGPAHSPLFIDSYEMKGQRFYRAGDMESCLLGYRRGKFRARQKLGLSNLYGYWDYYDEQKNLIKKPTAFLKWARSVFRWIRENASVIDP